MRRNGNAEAAVIAGIVFLAGVVLVVFMFGIPWYGTYSEAMAGKAKLARSESEKLILVEQAKAELEAAEMRAKAISIMGESAKKYPEYRHQEFIGAFADALKEGKIQQIIYVPTEANIPIVEATRKH